MNAHGTAQRTVAFLLAAVPLTLLVLVLGTRLVARLHVRGPRATTLHLHAYEGSWEQECFRTIVSLHPSEGRAILRSALRKAYAEAVIASPSSFTETASMRRVH